MNTRLWILIAILFILIGAIVFCGVVAKLDWNFESLATVKYETREYTISDEFQNIFVITDTANITLTPSEDEHIRVICYEQENTKHTVTVKDCTLTIQETDARQWYEYIGIRFGSPKITVYLPQKEFCALSAKATTGNIQLEQFSADDIDLEVTTGKVTFRDVTGENVKIEVSTGKTDIDNLRCKNLFSGGNTGDTILKNVIATEKFSIERTTGDVRFENCDAAEISVETDTGDVTGSLLTDKVFFAETDTGRVNVPHSTTGGKCEIETDTGDIRITVN